MHNSPQTESSAENAVKYELYKFPVEQKESPPQTEEEPAEQTGEYEFASFTTKPKKTEGTVADFQLREIKAVPKPEEVEKNQEPDPDQEEEPKVVSEEEKIIERAHEEAAKINKDARIRANEIIDKVMKDAAAIEEASQKKGYAKGYEEGFAKGTETALAEHKVVMDAEVVKLKEEIKTSVRLLEYQKDSIVSDHILEIRDLVLSIAEKVINVSLKSSGEIIERMIVTATEKIKNKQWAKIYISKYDADLMLEADIDILESIKHVSEMIKVEILENEKAGTFITELPDRIIDASVSTQMANITELFKNN
ncbi:MAG: hypothetical protein FWH14_07920 [Oscillospiraceae bacterium]|nr:hypothetical protein [Oscillospiraceae bacterium]